MATLTSLKSDYIKALENCIKNCQQVIDKNKDKEEMRPCVSLCELCIDGCIDCIAAFKSVHANRAQFIQVCMEIGKACIANFESLIEVGSIKPDFVDLPKTISVENLKNA